MISVPAKTPQLAVHLRLGRVSNLPTVWTNVLAGTVIAGVSVGAGTLAVLAAISAFYLAGMYLNDAFDRAIDARERPGRPIPAGEIGAGTVFAIGFGLLAAGVAVLALFGTGAALAGCALAAAIVMYDAWHKGNPASPLVMGLCRALVYVTAGAAAAGPAWAWTGPLAMASVAMLAHVAGLTYAARQESLDRIGRLWPLAVLALPMILYALQAEKTTWLLLLLLALADADAVRLLVRRAARGDVPRAVARLIAAVALLDGVVIAAAGGSTVLMLACVAACVGTRLLHRLVPGT